MSQQRFTLPDILLNWPSASHISPFYEDAKRASSTWVESFSPFDRKGQDAFNACDLNLLAALAYSNRNAEFVRVGCDFMNLIFVFDEYTDVAEPIVARQLTETVLDAMRNPKKTSRHGEHLLGEMTRQFWVGATALEGVNTGAANHFIAAMEFYIESVAVEAKDRAEKRVRSVEEYLKLRRGTVAGHSMLALTEFGLNLPDEVLNHPVIVALREAAVEMILIVNDMQSYISEVSSGLGDHNLVTAIIHEHHLELQDAFNWLGDYSDKIVAGFNENLQKLPSFGEELDKRVKIYVDGCGQWPRGEDDWSYETKRYHGDDGPQVRKTRQVTLRQVKGNYVVRNN
ncbi:terpenoid synthase [Crepidotus variabilis]|uniref:Terpene synthase n=1 Tax=Crepidotus variabilis TaxID=179855 RepID=A0A9P6EFL4_9AGAR|nr:terpenoid synthase [Crepidotus variabilis]